MTPYILDVPSIAEEGIQMGECTFENVIGLSSNSIIEWINNDWDADALDRFIRQRSDKVAQRREEPSDSCCNVM